jgi:four helix bundle protein
VDEATVPQLQLKCEKLLDYGYIALKQYPSEERFVLSQRTRESMWEVETLMICAFDARAKGDKIAWMHRADKELKRLMVLFRHGHRLGFLSHKKYEVVSYKVVELGRMIGGWISSVSRRQG